MVRKGLSSSSVLYVGQIPYDWDEKIVKSVVCGSGNIVDVRLGYDYAGKNKGFCFIEYQTPQEAQHAIGLLEQIKLVNPMQPGQYKKLRIELSKEGLRSNSASDSRATIPLDRSYLPSFVQLPQEMIYNGPPIPQHIYNTPPNLSHFQTSNEIPPTTNHISVPTAQYNQSQNINQSNGLPPLLIAATKNLPQPQTLPFSTPDKISETLSKIPPAQMIELIANLKNILNGPGSARAINVFQLSPHLATAASQALLLMGLIDEDVISESMKSASEQTHTPTPPSGHLQPTPIPMPLQGNNLYGPPISMQQPQITSKWPHLPQSAQLKLAAMAPDQADLIAQILSLPSDQISSLPQDKQSMVINIRSQYL